MSGKKPFGLKDIFDPNGRINRVGYFTGGAILGMMGICVGFGVGTLISTINLGGTAQITSLLLMVIMLPILYGQFCVTSKRLHDLNISAAFSVFSFSEFAFRIYVGLFPKAWSPNFIQVHLQIIDNILMIVAFVFAVSLLFLPGTKGPNRYGSYAAGDGPSPTRIPDS